MRRPRAFLDAEGQRVVVVACLLSSNAVNVGFLAFDDRMWHPQLMSGAALLVGGLGYVVAVPLTLRRRPAGFALCAALAMLASVVVVGDNFALFGGMPNLATYALNFVFFALQVPLAAASVLWTLEWRRSSAPRSEASPAPK